MGRWWLAPPAARKPRLTPGLCPRRWSNEDMPMMAKTAPRGKNNSHVNHTDFPHERILRIRAVLELTGRSQSRIYEAMAAGTFPKPIPIGDRAVGWLQSEVMAW